MKQPAIRGMSFPHCGCSMEAAQTTIAPRISVALSLQNPARSPFVVRSRAMQ